MINNDYIIELPQIQWDQSLMLEYMYANKDRWKDNGFFFKPTADIPVFSSLLDQLSDFNVNISRSLFGRIEPRSTLPPHIDPARDAGIYFPIVGDWVNSPIVFNKDNKGSVDKQHAMFQHVYTCPTIINASKIHYVENNSDQERITYMLTFVGLSWEQTKTKVKEKYGI